MDFRYLLTEPWPTFVLQLVITTTVVRIAQEFRHKNGFFRLVEQFACVWQTVVMSFEIGIIRAAYGDLAFAAAIFGVCVLYMRTFNPEIMPNPTGTVDVCTGGNQATRMSLEKVATQLAVQFAAAWTAYKYISAVWLIASIDAFRRKTTTILDPCVSHVSVPLLNAVLMEAFITFLFRFIVHGEHRFHRGLFVVPVGAVLCTFIGMPFTGGYFNPALAFSMQFGCQGHGNLDFYAVYVLGPAVGAVLAGLYADSIWRWVFPKLRSR